MVRLKKDVVPKTNAEKQAEFRKRMKEEGFTQRMLWIKAGEPTPTPDLIEELETARQRITALETELTQTRQALAETESKYQALLQSKPAAGRGKKISRFDTEKERVQSILACCTYLLSKGNEGIGISKELLSNFNSNYSVAPKGEWQVIPTSECANQLLPNIRSMFAKGLNY